MKVELVAKTQGVNSYEGLTNEEIISAIQRHKVIKDDKGKLVRYLMEKKHMSPLDMINYTFYIETSRAIGRHIIRHSSLKPTELSQRYSGDIELELPIEFRKEHPINRQSSTDIVGYITHNNFGVASEPNKEMSDLMTEVSNHLNKTVKLYNNLVEKGIAKECARMILPECTRTKMHFNGTLRSWLSFLNVRHTQEAQQEVREIAVRIGETLEKELPNLFSVIEWRNGYFM